MWLAYALAALAMAIGVNAVASGVRVVSNVVVHFTLIAAGVGIVLLIVLIGSYGGGIEMAAAVLMYGLGCQLYVFLFTLALSSVSVNIMRRLQTEALTDQELSAIYGSDAMIEMRIDRLVHSNFLKYDGDEIEATARGRRLASLFNLVRRLFGHA